MENGVGNADGALLGERKVAADEVLESKVEAAIDLGLAGQKDQDADEVFEEAVESMTPRIESNSRISAEGRSVENVEKSSLENDNENSSSGNEAENEKFEEAIGVSSGIQNSDGKYLGSTEVSIGEQSSSGRENVPEKVTSNEINGFPTDAIVQDRVYNVLETADLNTVGETENFKDGNEKNEELDDSSEKLGNGMLDYLPTGETSNREDRKIAVADVLEKEIHEPSATQVANEVKGGDTDPLQPENEVLDRVDLGENLTEEDTQTFDADSPEQKIRGSSETQDVYEEKGCATDALMETNSNRDVLHQDEYNIKQTEPVVNLNSGSQDDKSKGHDGLHFEHQEGNVGEHGPISIISDCEVRGHENANESNPDSCHEEPKKLDMEDHKDFLALDTSGADHIDESSKIEDKLHSSIARSTVKQYVEDLPSQDSTAESVEKIPGSSPGLAGESSNPSQQHIRGAILDKFKDALSSSGSEFGAHEREHSSLKPPENGQKNIESAVESLSSANSASPAGLGHAAPFTKPATHNISVNREPEVKPTAGIQPSTGSSTSPARPAGLGPAAPLREPASQSTSLSREQEMKPAASSSTTNANSTTPARPAGLGRAAPLLEPAARIPQQPRVNGAVSPMQNQLVEDPTNGEAEEYDETREKLQMIRVKFLRLAHRLGQTPHNVVVAQVLYRLGLAEQLRGRSGGRVGAFSFDRASAMAEQLEAAGQEPLDFTCTIMVLGKTGVGKSATINSIFDEVMFGTNAFQMGTKKVQDVVGTVQGIKVRVIDTPGLLPSWSDQHQNEKILHSVKRFIKKTPPDIVLYLDRLDMQSRDFGDMPLLRTITEIFGPSIWFNAIVVLTHAASAPPEGPNGTVTSYDMFVTQRSHVVQQAIRQAAGDMRLMNPVSLVENHSACRTNRAGQRVLPNGQVWKPHLLLLSFASKILAEANTLLKLQDSPPGKPFAPRTRSPSMPFLLSSLLQSRSQVRLPSEQLGDEDALDDDLDESSDSEDESEYDELPPFKPLTKAQMEKLSKASRKAYYDELEFRERLFMKKQLKEEKRRRRMMRKIQEAAKDLPAEYGETAEEESGGSASVPVPMPDLALPASFDSDNPTHRYRCLDSSNQWLVRPVLEPNGWDHDVGYEGINVERLFAIRDRIPVSLSGQVSKDKRDATFQMEIASSLKHGKGKATSFGFDMQSMGKDIVYTVRSESRFSNHRKNKATAGLSVTLLGDVLTGGLKVEDKLIINKQAHVVVSGGAMFGRGDVAYGGSLEATLRDKDHPLGRFLSTLSVSIMDWHGDLAVGCNSQTQIPVGRNTNLIGRFNINNRGAGHVSIRLNSSEQLQIVLVGLIPLVQKLPVILRWCNLGSD